MVDILHANSSEELSPIDIQNSTISFLCLFVEVVVVFPFYSSSLECEKGGLGTERVSSGQILIK